MSSRANPQIAVMVKILEDIVMFYHFSVQCHFNIFFLGFSKHHEYFIFFQGPSRDPKTAMSYKKAFSFLCWIQSERWGNLIWEWRCPACDILGGASGKEPASQWRRRRRPGFHPWVGEIPLEKEMATHCSTLAWRIPRTEEPGGLQSIATQRVGHD